jgi:hypothetical protein
MSPQLMFLITFLVILVVTTFCLWYLWPRTDESRVLGPFVLTGVPGDHEAIKNPNNVPVFTQAQINRSLKNNFTLSFFIYMNKINAERIPFAGPKGEYRFKPLVKIQGFGEFVLNPVHQTALLRTTPLVPAVFNKTFTTPPYVELDNIFNDRWNQIVISVEGRSIDLYVNGKHATSLLLENLTWSIPTGVFLETSPDFWGQAGFIQAWPRRLTESEILRNYQRNTDQRGKPHIPDKVVYKNIWDQMARLLCKAGFCPDPRLHGLEYIDYEYA